MNKYVFDTIDSIVGYLIDKKPDITPLRLQKSLYFLYGYYGATYGQMTSEDISEGEFEGSYNYPKELFPAEFQAWKFGPVIKEVYHGFNNEIYKAESWNPKDDIFKNVKIFVDDILDQLDKIGDFGLVERSHMDESWKNVYKEGEHDIPMSNSCIIKEYVDRYV